MFRVLRVGIVAGALVLAGIAASVSASSTPAAHDHANADAARKSSAAAFRADMRQLWEEHIVWTRQYIVSAATLDTDLPDIGPTANRLFANQADIGNAIAAFYGNAAGQQLTALLTDHIAIAADAIAQAKQGNDAGLQAALDRWYANADDIAALLARANPVNWPEEAMRDHMRGHLDLTLAEAVARLTGDYAADIAAYDQVHEQILEMADMLSSGIIAQFPARFNAS
jgi:hypothetical protein